MRARISLWTFLLVSALAFLLAPNPVCAWGCKGHQSIALIAEKHLTPEAKEFVEKLLRENPVDPQTGRYCGGPDLGLLAAASTWADDIRRQRPETAPWHYINIPRGAARGPLRGYCGDRDCVTKAIAEQLAILKDGAVEPGKRAEALRFVIHLVGDLHMPLHASDNNDLGGNCVPLKYLRRSPRENRNTFSPNLHSLWDVTILERDMEGAEPPEYAGYLEEVFGAKMEIWRKAGIQVDDWAWESHDWAESVAYGDLTPKIPVETPVAVRNCTDANHIGERMLALHVSAGDAYQSAAAPIVEERIAQAGVRLAVMLNDAALPKVAQ
jgi:S1/P1 Nuclease